MKSQNFTNLQLYVIMRSTENAITVLLQVKSKETKVYN